VDAAAAKENFDLITITSTDVLHLMSTHPHRLLRVIFLLLASWLPLRSVSAATISWGSDFSVFPAPELLDSSGTPLDASYSFEIGSFGSFTPTMGNIADWQANWKVFDRSYDPTPADPNDGDPFGWNPGLFFVGVETHNALGGSDSPDANPADVFGVGEVAYLWAYNSKSIVPGSDPDSAWSLATADTAIIGSVNPSPVLALQTAPVPEPSSAFLLFAAAATHLIRRARRLSRTSMV